MKNRDVYQRDPFEIALLNNGVATVTDALTGDERRTLRFELTHFVCEGQYRSGLVRVLESYLRHQGQPEQPAAWISGFFGSGKSHLAKMLRFLWTDYAFPEDGARARGLARLPDDVRDLFTEVSTLGRRGHGLHAAAGTLGAGAGDSVRLALLGIVFKSAGLPESFPQARFCLWLRKNGIYEQVRDAVAEARRGSRPGPATAPGTGRDRAAVETDGRESQHSPAPAHGAGQDPEAVATARRESRPGPATVPGAGRDRTVEADGRESRRSPEPAPGAAQERDTIEAAEREFRRELNDLYVSPLIARALLAADPHFAGSEKDARAALRTQFPRPADVTTDECAGALKDALAPGGEMPCTAIILDEVQQYIGEDTGRSYVVQEVVEACSKRFGDRLLFLGTGQTALSGTPALQRLQGRFTVNVELSDHDVETVIRRVVLAKRPDRTGDVQAALDASAGEIDRHLTGTRIAPRNEDKQVLVEDYPLLPVRRRFWEQALRAVDRAGTAGQLRTQLRIVYDAIRRSADDPVGTVVPADFLFEEISANLLQSGVLLREIHEAIAGQDDGAPGGALKSRLCALVFLIRKLPREAGVDSGVRATADTLADLLVQDLAGEGAALRGRIPALLDELAAAGTLMKLDDEYSLQTRESSEWEAEFRNRQSRLANDLTGMSGKRTRLIGAAVQEAVGSIRLLHGACKEPRKLSLHFGAEPPPDGGPDVAVWIRDGWGADEKSAIADARAAGPDSPTIHVFVPKSRADALARLIAARSAAHDTLEYKGVPSTHEGIEARQGMETRRAEAENGLRALVADVVGGARVLQGGGNERLESTLSGKVKETAGASLARLFPEFGDADDARWPNAIERARRGAEHPLEVLDHRGRTEDHPVCAAVLAFVGSGRKGRDVRAHFSASPCGWPRDAVDAALIGLLGAGHLRAVMNGVALRPPQLDQAKVPNTDFRVESATIDARQRLKLRKLFQTAGVDCKPNEEAAAAGRLLALLHELAREAGGDPPLPERPDTRHLADLGALAGNEQLAGILGRYDELAANFEEWSKARALTERRLPAWRRLLALARHGEGLAVDAAGGGPDAAGEGSSVAGGRPDAVREAPDAGGALDAVSGSPDAAGGGLDAVREAPGAVGGGPDTVREAPGAAGGRPDAVKEVQPQIQAIAANRSLLAPPDPVPDLAGKLADALRAALADAEDRHARTHDEEWQRLSSAESWRTIGPEARAGILGRLRIEKASKGATGTEQEVLESLERISLDGWRTRTAALPRLFADARAEADRLVEPAVRHVKLESSTLRSPEDVKDWVEATERELLDRIRHGPVVVG